MPSKTEEYLALAQRTANGLTRYWESWTDYLTTASRLYKYPFADQLMIYAQRPDATACAEFDIWRNRMNRYVRRGSKGIALLDESSGFPRLHYVFDVSDTGVRRNSRDPEVWQLGPDLVQPVSEMLNKTYGISGERISQQLADVAGKLVADYWDNNGGDIRAIVDGSLLMDYDEAGVEMQFKSAAAISVTYTLLERCGFEPAGWFDKDDFQAIYNFSTPDAVFALGAAVSDMSREVLRNIERTVKTTIRRRNAERSQYEYEQQERDLLDHRGLPAPEPDPASAEDPAGQVRQAAPDVPDEPSPGTVQHDAPEREPVPAPDGGGADGREPDAADHAGTAEAEPGSEQGAASDGVGAAHEQSESTGRGTGAERTDLQLSFFDAHIPTEAKQIESIDQAESEKSPSAFSLSQTEIENALRRGSNFENSKLRIWKIYQLQPDRKLRAKALAKEYAPNGPGGSSHTYLDGSNGWLDHDSKGLTFEHYPDHQKVLLRWDRVEKYIDLMIQSDRYLSDKERRAIDFPLELNAASAAEYTALKAQHPDTLVGFEAGGNFMFYGEDAVKVSKIINGKIGLDVRLMNPMLPDDPNSKLNVCVRNVLKIWDEGKDQKLTQLLFCDLSTPKNDGNFNVYDDIRKKLVAAGVPENEIEFIHNADTEAKKAALFSKVRSGDVRVLLGSTAKMGAGTNVQSRLVAVHHLDVGWKPSDMTQRNGRIIRQGNMNKEVKVFNYVTEGTFDSYLFQTLENKQRFISQIMTSKSPVRSCEDVDEQALSYAEIKALCAGNPLIKEKMDLDVQVAKLKVLKADHQSQKFRLQDKLLTKFPADIQETNAYIAGVKADAQLAAAHPQVQEGFCGMTIKGVTYDEKKTAGERLVLACSELPNAEEKVIGSYRGFELSLRFDTFRSEYQAILKGQRRYPVALGTDPLGNIIRLDNSLNNFPERINSAENELATLHQQQAAAQIEVEKPFPQEEELAEKSARLAELNAQLDVDEKSHDPEQDEEEQEDAPRRPSVLAALEEKSDKPEPVKPFRSYYDKDGDAR